MSRIGKIPVPIPDGVQVTLADNHIETKGPKGAEALDLHPAIHVEIRGNEVHVTRPSDRRMHRSLHGLTRTLVANVIEGVHKGFERTLEINGVGYRATLQGKILELAVGFAHPIQYEYPKEVEIVVEGAKVTVRGTNKKMVGEVAAKIRSFRPPEPYNGKGVKYAEEVIRRKAGKATA